MADTTQEEADPLRVPASEWGVATPAGTPRPTEIIPSPEGSQTPEELINTLTNKLIEQNGVLGGEMMFSIPITDIDKRQVYLFHAPSTGTGEGSFFWGVHPEKGAIGVRGKLVQDVQQIYRESYGKKFIEDVQRLRFASASDFLVDSDSTCRNWMDAYQQARDRGIRIQQQETAKRRYLPNILKEVSRFNPEVLNRVTNTSS